MLSRVADSLYWMSRYFERADHCARVLEANHNLMLNPSKTAIEERWHRITENLGLGPDSNALEPQAAMLELMTDPGNQSSIVSCITGSARKRQPGSRTDQFRDVGAFEPALSRDYADGGAIPAIQRFRDAAYLHHHA